MIRVSFASWPPDPESAWTRALAQMGVQAEFHPDFDPVHPRDAQCAVALGFPADTSLPVAAKLRGFGQFVSAFWYETTPSGAVFSITFASDRLAALVCACALAAATGGEIVLEEGPRAYGSDGAELLGKLVPEGTLLEADPKPLRFGGGWQV